MTSDRAALLHAIADRPDEDTPRLAYADWLDEHAAELPAAEHAAKRAEFIRCQVAVARLAEDDPRRAAAASSVTALLAVYRDAWFPAASEPARRRRRRGEPDEALPWAAVEWPVERGFATRVTVRSPVEGWAEYIGQIVAAEPIGEFVAHGSYGDGSEPVAVADLVAALDAWPRADRFRSLALHSGLSAAAAARLGRCPHLTNLRRLHVELHTPRAVEALAEGPVVERITGFTFRGGGAAAVAALVNRTAVAELTLGTLTDSDAAVFLSHVTNPSVNAISALHRGSRDPTLAALSTCPVMPQVRSLDLRANYWSAPALARFLRTAPLQNLRVLRASHAISSGLERAGEVWRAILGASFAPRFVELDIGWRSGLTARELRPIADGHFPELRVLSVGPGQPGDEWVEALARGPCGPRLTALTLWDCGVTDRGAKLIADQFPALERVDLRQNPVGPAAKAQLAARFGRRLLA